MTFEEAVRKAIKNWHNPNAKEQESFKGLKYNKKYFDALKTEYKKSDKKDEEKSPKKEKKGY